MRKPVVHVKRRIYAFFFILIVAITLYLLWFVFPYVSFFIKSGLIKVFLYPTTALIRSTNNVVTITLYGTGTTVMQYDLRNQKMVLIRGQSKVAQIRKSKGYYIIFSDQHHTELEAAASVLVQLSNWRLILGRQRYIELIQRIDNETKKNISLLELFALWRSYFYNQNKFTIEQQ